MAKGPAASAGFFLEHIRGNGSRVLAFTFANLAYAIHEENHSMFFAALSLAAMLANPNDVQPAYTDANPVAVAACSVEPEVAYYNSAGLVGSHTTQIIGQRVNVTFSNTANKPISSVTFTVRDGKNQAQSFTDVGTFSSGVTIAHSFKSPISNTDHLSCSDSTVTFSDGSTWTQQTDVAQAMKQ